LRVLDVATMVAGPFGCQLLADFGADVVKIEHPRLGDSLRNHGRIVGGKGLWWKVMARNKRCIALDLADPEGADVFLRLAAEADVVVEGFRPGTMERFGLGPDRLREVNPRLVLVRVSGFGQTGPYATRSGFGTLAEAMSGFAAMTGEADRPPVLPPFGLADGVAGITVAFATMLSLYHRDARGGTGQIVDLSILEPLINVLGVQATVYSVCGEIPPRTGNRSSNNAPRNTYRTADGHWVAVSTSALSIAERVMRLVAHPEVIEEKWFGSGSGRAAHVDLLDEMVGGWIRERSRDEVIAAFTEANAAIAPVYDISDLMADEHVQERKIFMSVPDPDFGTLLMQNVIARLSESPGSVVSTGRDLGADTDEVLGRLGLSEGTISALRERGAIA
jgi:crotonobetainyl-CoA:carnitine CoA-transferase CaiB-like acyl-CoA transferase